MYKLKTLADLASIFGIEVCWNITHDADVADYADEIDGFRFDSVWLVGRSACALTTYWHVTPDELAMQIAFGAPRFDVSFPIRRMDEKRASRLKTTYSQFGGLSELLQKIAPPSLPKPDNPMGITYADVMRAQFRCDAKYRNDKTALWIMNRIQNSLAI